MISENEIIGNRIKSMRLRKNYSVRELSKLIGVNTTYLANIESGKIYPSFYSISKLCEILDVNSDYIVLGDFYSIIEPYIENLSENEVEDIKKLIIQAIGEQNERRHC